MRSLEQEIRKGRRITTGFVQYDGSIVYGASEFSVNKTGAGTYVLTFFKYRTILAGVATAAGTGAGFTSAITGGANTITVTGLSPAGVQQQTPFYIMIDGFAL